MMSYNQVIANFRIKVHSAGSMDITLCDVSCISWGEYSQTYTLSHALPTVSGSRADHIFLYDNIIIIYKSVARYSSVLAHLVLTLAPRQGQNLMFTELTQVLILFWLWRIQLEMNFGWGLIDPQSTL